MNRTRARRVIFPLSPRDGPGAMCNRYRGGSQGDEGSGGEREGTGKLDRAFHSLRILSQPKAQRCKFHPSPRCVRPRDRGELVQVTRLSRIHRDAHEGSRAQKLTLGKEGLFLTWFVSLNA